MKFLRSCILVAVVSALASSANLFAQAQVWVDHNAQDKGFRFEKVPPPAVNDAATGAQITVVSGEPDPGGADVSVLTDGVLPSSDDEPKSNFFFAGEKGGRLVLDLGKAISIGRVGTYSWHSQARAPQSYKLYGAAGTEPGFSAEPQAGVDPKTVGWTPIAEVKSQAQGDVLGGQYAASIVGKTSAGLGKYRYLLFDIRKGVPDDAYGNTFFNEIDVVDMNGPQLEAVKVPEKIRKEFKTLDGKYTFIVDATIAPDLMPWAEKELMPVIFEWYPKIIRMLPSPGFTPVNSVLLEFRTDMEGVPAYAAGPRVALNAPFIRGQLAGEAKGAVVHELTHVVQDYGWSRRRKKDATKVPFWIQEGVPDYIRWFLYEPEAKGAEITKGNFAKANYDSAYRISANFLNWVVGKYDRSHDLIRKVNQANREGTYTDAMWKQLTGKTLEQLNEEWKTYNAKKLGIKYPSES